MPIGILIPADETKPLVKKAFDNLADYQAGVGGYIQSVDLANPAFLMFVNEEGKIQRLPVNKRATLLLWLHCRPFLLRDEICGDAIVLGPVRQSETTDTPESLAALLLETRGFIIESRLKRDPDRWQVVRHRRGFDSWVNAYGYALMLTRLIDVVEVRVSAE